VKWIRTRNGDKAHAVSTHHAQTTLCGIQFKHIAAIVLPGPDDRCGNCDAQWRQRAKKERPKRKKRTKDVYAPRFTFKDWEG
jgi:hypothetical protein